MTFFVAVACYLVRFFHIILYHPVEDESFSESTDPSWPGAYPVNMVGGGATEL